jgi:hypothetical protein
MRNLFILSTCVFACVTVATAAVVVTALSTLHHLRQVRDIKHDPRRLIAFAQTD